MKNKFLFTIVALVFFSYPLLAAPPVLISAVTAGDIEQFKNILQHEDNIFQRDEKQKTALMHAALKNQTEMVETFFRYAQTKYNQEQIKQYVNQQNYKGWTAFSYAAYSGSTEVGQLLSKMGADINHLAIDANASEDKVTPLYIAASKGHSEFVNYLLQQNTLTTLDTPNPDTKATPLSLAAYFGHDEIVALLIAKGANIETTNKAGLTPLLRACMKGHVICLQSLLNYGANALARDQKDKTALMYAAMNKHSKVMSVLFTHIKNKLSEENQQIFIDGKNDQQYTALSYATVSGCLESVKMLIEAGADRNHQGQAGDSILYMAAHQGHLDIVKYLLTLDEIQIDLTNQQGETAFICAVKRTKKNKSSIIQELLEKGVDVELKDHAGKTALDYDQQELCQEAIMLPLLSAVRKSDINIVNKYIEIANVNHRFNNGLTLLHYAVEQVPIGGTRSVQAKYLSEKEVTVALDIIKRLIEKGADVNASNDFGQTPLHIAAINNGKDAIEILLTCPNININPVDHDHQTPLDIVQSQHQGVFELLQHAGAQFASPFAENASLTK